MMASPDIDVNDVLNSLGAQIASLTVQNATLQAQLLAYQKEDETAQVASTPPLSVVDDD